FVCSHSNEFFRAKAKHHGKGFVGLCLDWRSTGFSGWFAGRLRSRDRQREKGRLQDFDLVGADRRWRGTPPTDQRRSRFNTALVAGWKIFAFRSCGRERWKDRTCAVVDPANGRRRFFFVY